MGRLFEFFRKADNVNCAERTFFYAYAAADTEFFRYYRLAFFIDDHRLVTRPYARAIDDTLGATFFCMATIFMNNRDSHEDQKMVMITLALQSTGLSMT